MPSRIRKSVLIMKEIVQNCFEIIFEFSPRKLSYAKFLRVYWYQNFQKNRTKNYSKVLAKYLSSEKCIFDHEKDENWNFWQARMKVYDFGYHQIIYFY